VANSRAELMAMPALMLLQDVGKNGKNSNKYNKTDSTCCAPNLSNHRPKRESLVRVWLSKVSRQKQETGSQSQGLDFGPTDGRPTIKNPMPREHLCGQTNHTLTLSRLCRTRHN